MKTDYKNINSFEVAVVCMITVGLVIVSLCLFAGLPAKQQVHISSALNLFDLHEQTVKTLDVIKFTANIPNEFYNQFYIAFTQVAILPEEAFEVPTEISAELARNVTSAFNNLSEQARTGYAAANQLHDQNSQLTQLPYDGKIMGAMIELSDKVSTIVVVDQAKPKSLYLHYEYIPPKFDNIKRMVERKEK